MGDIRRDGQTGGWGPRPIACPNPELTATLTAVFSLAGQGKSRNLRFPGDWSHGPVICDLRK